MLGVEGDVPTNVQAAESTVNEGSSENAGNGGTAEGTAEKSDNEDDKSEDEKEGGKKKKQKRLPWVKKIEALYLEVWQVALFTFVEIECCF